MGQRPRANPATTHARGARTDWEPSTCRERQCTALQTHLIHPVRIRDVGQAVEGPQNELIGGWFNTQRAIILAVQRVPGGNVIDTANRIKALLPQLQASLPPGIKINVISDRTTTIRASVTDVQFTLVLTIALVVMVIFLFLRNFWATVIPAITVPPHARNHSVEVPDLAARVSQEDRHRLCARQDGDGNDRRRPHHRCGAQCRGARCPGFRIQFTHRTVPCRPCVAAVCVQNAIRRREPCARAAHAGRPGRSPRRDLGKW
jgi:hypothetical protein